MEFLFFCLGGFAKNVVKKKQTTIKNTMNTLATSASPSPTNKRKADQQGFELYFIIYHSDPSTALQPKSLAASPRSRPCPSRSTATRTRRHSGWSTWWQTGTRWSPTCSQTRSATSAGPASRATLRAPACRTSRSLPPTTPTSTASCSTWRRATARRSGTCASTSACKPSSRRCTAPTTSSARLTASVWCNRGAASARRAGCTLTKAQS